ncbi:MAG: alpha/beta hydrolase [Halobacteriota archaeon]|nr:alpha/beta hydrolase [Halobacteriota archaeon]
MPEIDLDGLKIHYESKGSGSSLILIHGAGNSHMNFKPQFDLLGDKYHVVAIDLPGHGRSGIPKDTKKISIEWYSRILKRFLEVMGINKATLIGHSMGGAISMQYALEYPQNVECLVLVSTGAKLGVSPVLFSILRSDFKRAIENEYETRSAKRIDPKLLKEVKEASLLCDPDVGVADFEACNRFDIRDKITDIESPTLIIGADDDKVHPLFWSEFLHGNIKDSELKIFSGDFLYTLEKPSEVNDTISNFLGRHLP